MTWWCVHRLFDSMGLCRHEGADAYLLNLLIVRCCDILITDRISSVVINWKHHVELKQVHKLNKQARCRKQGEAVGIDTSCKSFKAQEVWVAQMQGRS